MKAMGLRRFEYQRDVMQDARTCLMHKVTVEKNALQ